MAVPVERAQKNRAKEDPMLGTVIAGRYRITKKLGQGGMGVVYKGRQEAVDRNVAIKVLLSSLVDDESLVQRFHLEARAASKLTHPNTITIYDFGQHQEILYIAMEYLDGEPLSNPLKAGPMPPPRALHIMLQALRSLSEAHKKGIVHRDIKPDNIYLTEMSGVTDFVKVLDFGVAKLKTNDEKTLTKAGMIFGTPKYMSPEQARSQALDGRSDLYALGVMLYQMLMGQVPFDADDHVTVLLKHVTEPPPPFDKIRPDLHVPIEFQQVVFRAMAKDVKERYQSADEMLMALEQLAVTLQIPLGTSAFPVMPTGMQPMATVTPPAGMPTPVPGAGLTTGEVPQTTGGHTSLDGGRDLGITAIPGTLAAPKELLPPPPPPSSGPSTALIAALAVIGLLAAGAVVAFLVIGSGDKPSAENNNRPATAAAPASVAASAPPVETNNSAPEPPGETTADNATNNGEAETNNGTAGAVADNGTAGETSGDAPGNDTPPEKGTPGEVAKANVTVHLTSIPPGAEVYEGDTRLGSTPMKLDRPQATHTSLLQFKLDGFKTVSRGVSFKKSGSVQAILQRAGGDAAHVEKPATSGQTPSSLKDKGTDPYDDPYK